MGTAHLLTVGRAHPTIIATPNVGPPTYGGPCLLLLHLFRSRVGIAHLLTVDRAHPTIIATPNVEAIRESPLHLGVHVTDCVSPGNLPKTGLGISPNRFNSSSQSL